MAPMDGARRARSILDRDEVDSVLSGEFYSSPTDSNRRPKLVAGATEKPAHYKVICISMYTRDLDQLDTMVEELKARGVLTSVAGPFGNVLKLRPPLPFTRSDIPWAADALDQSLRVLTARR